MMEYLFVVLLVSLYALGFYFSVWRNFMVRDFMISLSERSYGVLKKCLDDCDSMEKYQSEFPQMEKIADSIRELKFEKVLYSFKPLRYEYWLTKEQIDFLNKYESSKDNS